MNGFWNRPAWVHASGCNSWRTPGSRRYGPCVCGKPDKEQSLAHVALHDAAAALLEEHVKDLESLKVIEATLNNDLGTDKFTALKYLYDMLKAKRAVIKKAEGR